MGDARGSACGAVPAAGWDDARWEKESRFLLAALQCLGVPGQLPVPGEPVAGKAGENHYATYLGQLIARVHLCWHHLPARLQTAVTLAASAELDQVPSFRGPVS